MYEEDLWRTGESRELVRGLDTRFRYAIDVRHASWFQDLAYNFSQIMTDVWPKTPPIVKANRGIHEKDFWRLQWTPQTCDSNRK